MTGRRLAAWELERARLQAWRSTRRKQDAPVEGFDYEAADEALRASIEVLRGHLRRERVEREGAQREALPGG